MHVYVSSNIMNFIVLSLCVLSREVAGVREDGGRERSHVSLRRMGKMSSHGEDIEGANLVGFSVKVRTSAANRSWGCEEQVSGRGWLGGDRCG